jgi:hypothetical protein
MDQAEISDKLVGIVIASYIMDGFLGGALAP